MLTEILIYTITSIIILLFSWFMGYRILKHFGYQIVDTKIDENDENNDVNYTNLLDH